MADNLVTVSTRLFNLGNKATGGALGVLVLTVLALAGNFVATGEFDAMELRIAGAGVLFGLASVLGAYFRRPDIVVSKSGNGANSQSRTTPDNPDNG